jgi:hypothetical protein
VAGDRTGGAVVPVVTPGAGAVPNDFVEVTAGPDEPPVVVGSSVLPQATSSEARATAPTATHRTLRELLAATVISSGRVGETEPYRSGSEPV